MPHQTVIADGTWDFTGGVNSQAVTTVRSQLVPNGIRRDQLPWISNATVRGGVISPRNGWPFLLNLVKSGLWQGGFMYEPIDGSNPYLVCQISGVLYKALLQAPFTVTNLTTLFGLAPNPATVQEAFFEEAEGFLIIQAGDYDAAIAAGTTPTLPIIYHSQATSHPETMRRSNGLTGNVTYPNINEIPAASCMVYFMGRLWYAQGRVWTAGDMVGNQASGSAFYNFRDSTHKVTENPLAVGGDGFSTPTQKGFIRAMKYSANLDTTLGQGPLYIFTSKQVYAFNPPVSRVAWIAADNNQQPLVTVAQINNGSPGTRNVAHVNGDLFYQSLTPDIRSLISALRYFNQWGNKAISSNVSRILQFNDRSLLRYASGLQFDNRMLQTALPTRQASGNVVFPALVPLDFDTISTFDEDLPPAWEGHWEGLDHLQLFEADFGGLDRCFSVHVNRQDLTLDISEISNSARADASDTAIQWYVEFPAFEWGDIRELKQLRSGELWVDGVFGTVQLTVFWRPDADPCWHLWFETEFCQARNCAEDVNNPVCYPAGPTYQFGYRFPIVFPEPPTRDCSSNTGNRRASHIGFQHQVKVALKGWCRIRGLVLYAEIRERALFEGLNC